MKTFATVEALQNALTRHRRRGDRIAFVPTMGNLHDGHIDLVRRAKQTAEIVVVSIYVNPLQFGANEDLSNYPRTLAADKEKLFAEGTDFLFTPSDAMIYPEGLGRHSKVTVPDITETLCGASRPGHFTGVTTVVNKLFNIVRPDVAVFGKKDFQQLAVIRKMVEDLCIPVEIIGADTVRAEDGLALSSRNGYLSATQRQKAPVIHQLLNEVRSAIAEGFDSYATLENHVCEQLLREGFEPDYVAIRDAKTLFEVTMDTEELVILIAARLGTTRLIDNVTLGLNPSSDWLMLASQ